MSLLDKARIEIDDIDAKMLELFEKRMAAVEMVVEHKTLNGIAVLDENRENLVVEKNTIRIKNDKYTDSYKSFIRSVMAASREYQTKKIFGETVGYQGIKGSFSQLASAEIFKNASYKNYETFRELLKAVASGEVSVAVMPSENSTTGEVGEATDELFANKECAISGYYDYSIEQSLLCLDTAEMEDIKQVYSHPQALAQSAIFFKKRGIELIAYENTAMAAEYVKSCNDKTKAAVASVKTAEIYGLKAIATGINSSDANTTRFLIITKAKAKTGERTSIFLTVNHEQGSIAKALSVIGEHGFNMECLRSRAMPSMQWQYYFYIEIAGAMQGENADKMLVALENVCMQVRVLGSYNEIK